MELHGLLETVARSALTRADDRVPVIARGEIAAHRGENDLLRAAGGEEDAARVDPASAAGARRLDEDASAERGAEVERDGNMLGRVEPYFMSLLTTTSSQVGCVNIASEAAPSA